MSIGKMALLRAASVALGGLPVGSGQHRVVNALYDRIIVPSTKPRRLRGTLRGSGAQFEFDLSDFVQAQTLLTRRYDAELVSFIQSRIGSATAVVMDVGAHIGLVTAQIALLCHNAVVYAFEPHPANVAALTENVARNGLDSVVINGVAMSDTPAGVILHEAPEGSNFHQVGKEGDGLHIGSVTLDDYVRDARLERVDVLKLDVEGHELSVLRGAEGILGRGAITTIVAEINEEFQRRDDGGEGNVAEFLRPFGYRMAEIPGIGFHRFHRPPINRYRNVFFERA